MLKTHVKRAHPFKFRQFEDAVTAGSRRGKHMKDMAEQRSRHPSSASSASESSKTPLKKQAGIDKWARRGDDTFRFSQEHADGCTVDFFVNNMIALKVNIVRNVQLFYFFPGTGV